MSRAEEAALKAYPYYPAEVNLFGHKTITADGNSCNRGKYREGYEQAEKDLALTWQDIRDIEQIINQVRNEYPNGIGAESFGEEVLRRFNKTKKDEQ